MILGDKPPEPISYDGMKRAAILDHFRTLGSGSPSVLYSLPLGNGTFIQPLGSYYCRDPGAARRQEAPDPLMILDGECTSGRDDEAFVFFRVVKMRPSASKQLQMPLGSRAQLRDTHAA
eukprot:6557428-Pyramimonas_sp.AAC.1